VYEYTPGVVRVPVLTPAPNNGSLPLQDPDAVQADAFAVDQVNAAELPATIWAGEMDMSTVTGGAVYAAFTTTSTLCAVLPPAPVHVNVYE
jgi:hypothetical protein